MAGCTLEVGLRPGGSAGSTERQVQAERGAGCVHLQSVSFQNGGGVGNSASAQGPHPPGGGLSLLLRVGQEATRVSIPTLARPRPGLLMLAESAFFFWKLPTCQADREGEDVLSCSDAAYGPGHGWPPGRFGGRALRPLPQQGRGHFLITGGACGGTRCQGPGGSPGPDGAVGGAWVRGGSVVSSARPRPPRPPAFPASPSELPPARPLQALLPRAHLCKHPPASRENGPFVPSLALVPQPRRQLRPQPGCHGPGLAIVPVGPAPPPPGSGQTTPVRSGSVPAAVRVGGAGWARVWAVPLAGPGQAIRTCKWDSPRGIRGQAALPLRGVTAGRQGSEPSLHPEAPHLGRAAQGLPAGCVAIRDPAWGGLLAVQATPMGRRHRPRPAPLAGRGRQTLQLCVWAMGQALRCASSAELAVQAGWGKLARAACGPSGQAAGAPGVAPAPSAPGLAG